MRQSNADAHGNGYTRLQPGWLVCSAPLPTPAVRAVGVYFPANGSFMPWVGAPPTQRAATSRIRSNIDPATNTWVTKAATYPDNQVNNMACGVLTVSGTPFIYCVGGSAAGADHGYSPRILLQPGDRRHHHANRCRQLAWRCRRHNLAWWIFGV